VERTDVMTLTVDRSRDGGPSIVRVFDDNYLELVRVLVEAAQIEHTLVLAYLHALFSVKARYASVRGDVSTTSFLEHDPAGPRGTEVVTGQYTLLDVALEEMQHLDLVNRFLRDLDASPVLVAHTFPFTSDIYPFPIEARALDRYAAATFLWLEADACALSLEPSCADLAEPPEFIAEVRQVLAGKGLGAPVVPVDDEVPSHLGSLYHAILVLTHQVAAAPPQGLAPYLPWDTHEQHVRWIAQEAELGHYRFFRDVFSGKAFGRDASVWNEGDPDYPSIPLAAGTAYPGQPHTIADPSARRLAWLSDLLYWIVLVSLDARYRSADERLAYHAVDVMTLGLWPIGTTLAEKYGVGVPFDPLGPGYGAQRGHAGMRSFLRHLLREGASTAHALEADGLLPEGFRPQIFETVMAALGPAPGP
jgi:hypothetical protein